MTAGPVAAPSARGVLAAVGTNLIWGIFPIYFSLLAPASAGEIVAARVILSFVVVLAVTAAFRRWRAVAMVSRRPRSLLLLTLAGIVIYGNWMLYVTSIELGRVIEASLAYFITPLLTALLGTVFLRERASPLFWTSLSIGAAAVVILVIGYGEVPWLGLLLATTFSVYGMLKRMVGADVGAIEGLVVETGAALPIAIVHAAILITTGQLVTGTAGGGHSMLMLTLGVVSLLPFITFGVAARHLQLIHLGFIGYITPVLIFISGILYFQESMPWYRWAGFAVIWVALLLFAVDAARGRPQRG